MRTGECNKKPVWRDRATAVSLLILTFAAIACVGGTGLPAIADPGAAKASSRVIMLKETAQLRVTKNTPTVHEAHGQCSGTIAGALYLRIVVENATRTSQTFSGSSRAGTLSGRGVSTYRVAGSVLSFTGTISISNGSGTYAHAYGSGIHIEGSMNRLKGTISMEISGSMHL